MSQLLHYAHHLWFDPISASEKFQAVMVLGLPALGIVIIGMILWAAFWERYTEERD